VKIVATEIEKMFMLKAIRPFDTLDERTLFNIVEVMRLTRFEEGAEILAPNMVSNELIIVVEGEILNPENNSVTIAGVYSLLNDTVVENRLIAGKNGCRCLRIGKGHFLTSIYESPSLLTELIQLRNINPHYYM
jgi:signal-transduction protein with cAMP-binding, CBS, and nucleotidyltransferase domain